MSEWKECTLVDIAASYKKAIISGPFGSNISSKYFTESGIPVIRGNNLSLNIGDKFIDDNFVFISKEKAEELGTWAEKDDLIFTAAGTIGQVGIIQGKEKHSRYIISNKQLRVTLNKAIIEPLYAYYWYASPFMIDTIVNSDTGSTIPLINLSVLKSLPILLPSLTEQRDIISVLSNLDDKIDLLHRQNKTLEAMAETLFRQWFVEEADEEWEEGVLGDVADFNNGKSRPGSIENGTVPIYGGNGILGFTSSSNTDGISIIIGRVGAYCGSLYIENKPIWITDNALSAKPKNEKHSSYLFYLLKSFNLNQMAEGSSHPLLTQTLLNSILVIIPSKAKIDAFCEFADSTLQKIFFNQSQIRILEKLRDTLLPKLMSGEVKVTL